MMASKYWIKLYHEILDDPKMGRLSDRLWRRAIELFLIAGDCERGGELPSVGDMAWRLRADEVQLENELAELAAVGIVTVTADSIAVTNFSKRQDADSDAERARRYRERNRFVTPDNAPSHEKVTDGVTTRDTDIDIDIDKEVDTDKDTSAKPAPSASADLQAILSEWAVLFPKKPQPKPTTATLQRQAATRMKAPDFRESWQQALAIAARSKFCNDGNWFDLYWFLKNDDNWRKCLAGKYGNGSDPALVSTGPRKIPGLDEEQQWAIEYIRSNPNDDTYNAGLIAELEGQGVNVTELLKVGVK